MRLASRRAGCQLAWLCAPAGSHTAVAVSSLVGELVDELTVKARQPGHTNSCCSGPVGSMQRLFALEDCRHVSARAFPDRARRTCRAGAGEADGGCAQRLAQLRQVRSDRCARGRSRSAAVKQHAAPLLEQQGCGVLTAAKLVAEVAGIERFKSDAQLAMMAGVAPLDASSGRQRRHRLNRRGNRQLNPRPAQDRSHPGARARACTRLSRSSACRGQDLA